MDEFLAKIEIMVNKIWWKIKNMVKNWNFFKVETTVKIEILLNLLWSNIMLKIEFLVKNRKFCQNSLSKIVEKIQNAWFILPGILQTPRLSLGKSFPRACFLDFSSIKSYLPRSERPRRYYPKIFGVSDHFSEKNGAGKLIS